MFLLGATGGFLSRLTRLLRRRPSFTDFGASSAQLLLAPIAGALSAAGVLLVQALVSLQLIGAESFGNVWDQPLKVEAGALAFLFGFSERLFDRAISAFDGTLLPEGTSRTNR